LDVVAFALIIGSDESQSKSQFITQSLGENTIGYRAVKQFFYPPDSIAMPSNAGSQPII